MLLSIQPITAKQTQQKDKLMPMTLKEQQERKKNLAALYASPNGKHWEEIHKTVRVLYDGLLEHWEQNPDARREAFGD